MATENEKQQCKRSLYNKNWTAKNQSSTLQTAECDKGNTIRTNL